MNSSTTTTTLAEPGAAGFLAAAAGPNGRRPAGILSAPPASGTGPLPDFSRLLSRGTALPPATAVPPAAPGQNPAPAGGALTAPPLPMTLGPWPVAATGEGTAEIPVTVEPTAAQPSRETVEAAGALLLSLWQALTVAQPATMAAGRESPATVPAQAEAMTGLPAATLLMMTAAPDPDGILPAPAAMPPAPQAPAVLPGPSQFPAAKPGPVPAAEATMPPALPVPTLPVAAMASVPGAEMPASLPVAASAPPLASSVAPISSPTSSPTPIELDLPGGVKLSLVPVTPAVSAPAESRPLARAGTTESAPVPVAGAKFAARLDLNSAAPGTALGTPEKIFLNPGQQQLRQAPADAGIGSADSGRNMPARNSKPAVPTTESPPIVGVTVREANGLTVAAALPPAPDSAPVELRRLAGQAVEAVVKLVDLQSARPAGQPSTVHLRLRVAGEDLAIRVELREGAVHTSFQTDSAELRRALSDEWQVAVSESQGRTLRLLEPQFVAPARGGTEGFSPGGQSAHGQAQSRPQPETAAAPRPAAAPPLSEAVAAVGPAVPSFSPTALHLTALA